MTVRILFFLIYKMTSLAFDIYGTLIDPMSIGSTLKVMVGDRARGFNILWRDKQLEYSFRKAAMGQFNHFSECTQQALTYCNDFLKAGLTESQMKELLGAYRKLPPYDETRECLKQLKERGNEIIAFSNGKKDDLISLFEHSGIIDLFDQIISVDEVETFKPSPRVYKLLSQKASGGSKSIWMVSANGFDVIGAAACGLKTVWLKRNPYAVLDPFGYEPDLVVTSLLELTHRF